VDGMDVFAVRDAVSKAVDQIRRTKRPYFVEARTYRFLGHSMADPSHGHYRTKQEVDEAKKRDPIGMLKQRFLSEYKAGEAEIKGIEEAVKKIVDEAVAFAEASPAPSLSELEKDVYAPRAEDGSHGQGGPSGRTEGGQGAMDDQGGQVSKAEGGSQGQGGPSRRTEGGQGAMDDQGGRVKI
jgi:TPP-dependent pyruvate/acetoin dehydrogenase alpha subunit